MAAMVPSTLAMPTACLHAKMDCWTDQHARLDVLHGEQ